MGWLKIGNLRGSNGSVGLDGTPGRDGQPGVPGAHGRDGGPGPAGMNGIDGKDGSPGLHGRDGTNGRDGTLKDLIKMVRRSERVMEFCFQDGTPIDGGLVKFNHPVFQGTFVKEADYEESDLVQWGGGTWIAIKAKPSGVPGQGNQEITGWRLFTKAGAPGKDLRPESPAPALPVVSVGKGS